MRPSRTHASSRPAFCWDCCPRSQSLETSPSKTVPGKPRTLRDAQMLIQSVHVVSDRYERIIASNERLRRPAVKPSRHIQRISPAPGAAHTKGVLNAEWIDNSYVASAEAECEEESRSGGHLHGIQNPSRQDFESPEFKPVFDSNLRRHLPNHRAGTEGLNQRLRWNICPTSYT